MTAPAIGLPIPMRRKPPSHGVAHGRAGVSAEYPRGGHLGRAGLSGPSWRTARGLRVGDGIRRLRALYPRAERHGRVLWLATGLSRIGTPQRNPVLAAWMRDGRVRSFTVQVFAAGD
jgi:hypothetical protein